MAKESTQHKLDRTRKPRVHITYDVEVGDAMEVKELPFVVGVMADLSGNPEEPLPPLKERKFVEVDRDTFGQFLKKQKPRFSAKVPNKLVDDPDAQLSVDLTFESMKDFEPEGIVNQVEPLKELLDIRRRLKSLQSRVSSSDEVEALLTEIIEKEDRRQEIAAELASEDLDDDASASAEGKE